MENLTIEAIVKYAKETGKAFELYSEKFDRFGDEICVGNDTHIGINLKGEIWYWWNTMNCLADGNADTHLFFRQRYNRNTGAVQSTWLKGYKAQEMILGN